jgi:hypothetical protein
MSNKKQTAVDWLAEQMLWNEFHCPYLERAKEMEKEQIEIAYSSDRPLLSCFEDGSAAKEYYKEIYETSN